MHVCNLIISMLNCSLSSLAFLSVDIPLFICFRIIWPICWFQEWEGELRVCICDTQTRFIEHPKKRRWSKNTVPETVYCQNLQLNHGRHRLTGWQTVPAKCLNNSSCHCQRVYACIFHILNTVNFHVHNHMFNFHLGFLSRFFWCLFDKINRNLIIRHKSYIYGRVFTCKNHWIHWRWHKQWSHNQHSSEFINIWTRKIVEHRMFVRRCQTIYIEAIEPRRNADMYLSFVFQCFYLVVLLQPPLLLLGYQKHWILNNKHAYRMAV